MTFLNSNTITLWKKYKMFEIHPNTNTNQYFNIINEYNFLSDLSISWDAK